MKFKKEIITILLIICVLFTISAISAADSGDEAVSVANDTVKVTGVNVNSENNLQKSNDDVEILGETDGGTFSELYNKITNPSGSTVDLWNDYTFDGSSSPITISTNNLIIDGHGVTTVDAQGYSKFFEVSADGVTIKNIKFINGYSTVDNDAGAIVWSGNNGNLLNCTFENNCATGTQSAGVLNFPYAGNLISINIQNCIFTNNKGSYAGVMIGVYPSGSIDKSIFVNNSGTAAGSIYWVTWNAAYITNSIFLNNVGTTDIRVNKQNKDLTLTNNWFGNTVENVDETPKVVSAVLTNWLYLDMIIESDTQASVSLNKLNDGSVYNYNLPKVNLDVSSINATTSLEKISLDNDGKCDFEYDVVEVSGYLTLSYYNFDLLTKEVSQIGNFTKLKKIINDNSVIDLNQNFEYDSVKDLGVDAIEISKSTIIDGHGHYIDAKELSKIFYFNDESNEKDLVLKNIIFTNAVGINGAAVYFKGNKIEIINCTFINNKATSQGDAIYIENANGVQNKILNSTIINNTGDNSVIYFNSGSSATLDVSDSIFVNNKATNIEKGSGNIVADYNWWGNNATNYNSNLANVGNDITVDKWYYLNMTVDNIQKTFEISLNNLNVESDHNYALPAITLKIVPTNAQTQKYATLNQNGKISCSFSFNDFDGSISAYYDAIEITKEISYFDDGSFKSLQEIISFVPENYILDLTHDVIYSEEDEITEGIVIDKKITINGNGYSIDAKGKSGILLLKNTADDTVFNNITFKNGYSNYGSAINIAYNCDDVIIKNSNFTNNHAISGGAIYCIGDMCSIVDCNFINNSASSSGGAIQYYHDNFCTLNQCTFINNSATGLQGGAIYVQDGQLGVQKSIFINNTALNKDGSAIYSPKFTEIRDSIFLENNGKNILYGPSVTVYTSWFGNNITNFDQRPNVNNNVFLTDWCYLTMDTSAKGHVIISLKNLCRNGESQPFNDYNLPNITLNIDNINISIQKTFTIDGTGEIDIPYILNEETGLISVKNENILMSANVRMGDFDILQKLVNENDVVELTRNYTYDLILDDITEGIVISKDNFVLNGNGYVIDAKGQSRIFNIIGKNVVISNVTIINGKTDDEGAAIYWDGEGGTLKSAIIVNNNANSAIYWAAADGDVNNCVILNNSAKNIISTQSDLNVDYNWFGNNASNYDSNLANVEGATINKWYFLNMTFAGSSLLNINLNNVYDASNDENTTNANYALPNINLTFTGENVTVQNNAIISQTGILDVPIIPDYKDLSLTASFETASFTKTNSLTGDFAILQQLINDAGVNGVINLDRNYTYIIGADSGTDGISVSYNNMTINGNGFTINAKGKSRIFNVRNGANITFNNITFINGYILGSGGAIYWYSGSDGTISNSTFINNSASSGGAIYWQNGANRNIANSSFINNSASTSGGAIYWNTNYGDAGTIFNSTFIKNNVTSRSQVYGGAIYIYSGDLNIIKSDFINNIAYSAANPAQGGVLYNSQGGNVNVSDSKFMDNIAQSAAAKYALGGVFYWGSSKTLSINNSTFTNNNVKKIGTSNYARGGVLWANAGKQNIINSTFTNNTAFSIGSYAQGGVIYKYTNTETNIFNSTFVDNKVNSNSGSAYGSVIYWGGGIGNITNSSFLNNWGKSSSQGAAIYGTGTTSIANIKNSIFLNNIAGSYNTLKHMYRYSGGTFTFDDCWFGNTFEKQATDEGITPVTGGIVVNNRLILDSIHDEYMVVGEDGVVQFVFRVYDNGLGGIYDSSRLPKVNLSLSAVNGNLNKNNASMEENILFNAIEKADASITASYNTASLTVPLTVKYPIKILTDDEITIYVGDKDIPIIAQLNESSATGSLSYSGGDEFISVTYNGYVNALKNGTSTVIVSYAGDENYAATSVDVTVNVIKYDTEIQSVDTIDVYWGANTQELEVEVISLDPKQVSLPFSVDINDTSVVELSQGFLTFLNAGKANITIRYAGDNKYNPSNKSIIVTVNKVPSAVEFTPSEIEFDYESSTTATLTLTGCTVDAENIIVLDKDNNPVSNCIAFENNVITISNLDAGTYTLKVTTTPDENHTSVDGFATITVNKVDSKVTFADVEFDYLQSGTTTLTLDGCSVDLVNISVVDHSEAIISLEGNVITVSNLSAGEYTLKVVTTPDANHKSVENTSQITVNKIDSSITLSKYDLEFNYPQSDSVTITNYNGCSVDIENITVLGKSGNFIALEGDVITVSGLGAGDYILKITTTPDKNHNSVDVKANVKVNKIPSEITLSNENLEFDFGKSDTTELKTLVGCTVDDVNITVEGHPEAVIGLADNVITVSGLNVGTYTLKVTTTPDENHTSVNTTADVKVNKANSSVKFSNEVHLFYSETGSTTLILDGCTVDLVNISVVDHPEAIISLEGDVITISGLEEGQYTLNVTSTPDSNHYKVSNTTKIFVHKESPKLEMDYRNITVGETEIVYVTLGTDAEGDVTVTITQGSEIIKTVTLTMDTRMNKTSFSDLKVGQYDITAYYEGQGRYNSSTLKYKLEVRPIYEYEFTAKVNDTAVDNKTNATVTLPSDATGKIVIGDIEVKITEPVTVIELPSSAVVGTNNVTVKYVPDADSKYAPRELVALYNVAKVDTEIVLEITNSTTANPVTIVANINATGNVTFIVNGKEYSRKITENKSTLELRDVAGGEYSVTAVYAGNAKYVNSTAGDKFTVEKIASEIEEFIVDPGEIQTDGTATVTVKVPGSGIVTITVNGKDTNVTVNEGVAELTLSDLPKGETIISAKYLGDDKYNGIETEEKTLTVKPVLDYDFTVDVVNITVGDDAIAYIMLPSDATGNINVSVSKGKDVLKSENITSIKYVIPLKLDVGTYNITAKYYGNDKYDVKTVTKQFSVNPLNVGKLNFTVVVNDTLVGQETNVTVSLPSDATGKLVINGQEYEIGEKITLTPGPAGINNVTVRYVPDENSKYGEDNVIAFYNVAKKLSEITIKSINVKAGQSVFVEASAYPGAEIIIYVDGKKTNNNDWIFDISAGAHTVVASVAETDEYLASSANYTFTVTKNDVKISVSGTPTKAGEKSTVTVDITDDAKGIVVVNVNGTEYSLNISDTKSIEVVMPNACTASLSARYLGDDYYNAKDSEATTIEVTEKSVREDYNVPSLDDVKVGDEVEIHVADDMDVYVDGVKQTPDKNGNVTLPATAGEHSVVIVANETSENKAVFDVTTYNVAKNDVEISVSGTSTLAGEKSTVTVDIAPDATGIVVINVNGTEYSLNISDTKSIEVVMPDAGNASLSARYLGDDKYAAKDVKGEPIEVTEKQDGVIDIPEIGVIEVGETRTIDDIPNNVDIYIDGNKTVPVSGQVIIPSTAGAHTIIAMVNETPTTKAAVKVVTYEVVKKESEIEIGLSDIEVGKPVTITVDAGARTVDVVYIDGKEYPVTDGYVEFTATAGTHTVIASLNETDEYLPVTANRTFEVYKKESEIEISSDDSVTVGQSIIISIDITPDTTGNVLVNVNGTVYSISLPERNLEIVLDKVGSYNITATYMGDDKFNGSVSNALTVNVEDKAVSKIDVQIPEDNRVGEEIVINVTSDVTPEVYVDGKKQNYRNGKVVIPSLEAGIHTIEVIIPETENNKANSTVKTFTVSKKDSSVKINGIDGDLIVDKFNKLNFNYEGNTVIVYLDGEVLTDYDLFKAAAGTHIITATVVEDSEYTSSSANYTFEIAKNTAEISVDGGYTTVGMKTTINVNIVDEATGIVIVNVNGTEYSLNISQTKSLDVVLTQPGEYDVSARYLGDDKYDEAVSESAKIVVADKKDGEIIIDVPQTTVYAGDDIEISVTSYGDGELTVTVDGIEQTLDQGTLTINNISAGNHTIVAVTPETGEYKQSSEVMVIEVVKKDTEISINVLSDEIYAGDDVEVEILSDNNDIIVTVDGVIQTLEDGILTIKNISAGSHTIEAVKYEDDEFNEYTAIEIIHAEKQSAEVSITVPQNVKAGDDVTIEVSSYDGADITVYVDGVKHEVKDGKVTIKATAGKHTVTASVDETYTHLASNDTKTFDVVKKDSSIEITATNVTEGQATTITVNTQLNEGIVVVKVGDKQAAVDLAKSKSVSITLDAPGTYEVSAEYLGSDIYAPAEASNITVEAAEKSSPEVNVTIPSVKAGEDETISVSIPNATGEVHVIVDGVDNIIPLDENGKANYTIPQMTAGDHSIVVVYPGDDTHDSKVVSQSITVDKQSSKADITVPEDIKAGETANVTVNIPGATGNVSVIIDGAETVVPLDENGSAVIPVSDIAGGKHSVVVVYDGDDTHDGFHDSKSFDVAQMKSAAFKDITVESSSISAVLADENGNPIKDALITYKINGKQSTTKTDDKGMFTINGISKAAVEFAYEGNDSIEPVNMSIDLQGISPIKTATEIKGEDFTQFACEYYEGERGSNFTFRLVDSQGKALANKQLYIGYNGVTLNRTTDENGYASVQINLKNAGLYTFVIVFLGDSDYNASMAVHKVTINKKTTSISAGAKTFKASAKTKKYTVTLKTIKGASIDGKTYLAAGKKVTLKINGKTYTAKTNAKGQATFSLKITKKGKFTTKISFDGDKSYEASSKSVKITIK